MALKVKPEHIEKLRQAMRPHLSKLQREFYESQKLSPMRYRWDAYALACKTDPTLNQWLCDTVYRYANDDHLDSVFKLLVLESEKVSE